MTVQSILNQEPPGMFPHKAKAIAKNDLGKYNQQHQLWEDEDIKLKAEEIWQTYTRLMVGEMVKTVKFHPGDKRKRAYPEIWQPVKLTPEMLHAGDEPKKDHFKQYSDAVKRFTKSLEQYNQAKKLVIFDGFFSEENGRILSNDRQMLITYTDKELLIANYEYRSIPINPTPNQFVIATGAKVNHRFAELLIK